MLLKLREKAIASPLLEAGAIDGARGILINITGSTSLKLAEVQQACTIIQSAAHDEANIVMEEAPVMAAAHTEGVAVDTLRDAMIANFEKEDLDVPAFLRKRTREIS